MGKRQYNFNAQRSWKDMTPEDAEILARSVELPSVLLESDHDDFHTMRMCLSNRDNHHPLPGSHHYFMAAPCDDDVIEFRALRAMRQAVCL